MKRIVSVFSILVLLVSGVLLADHYYDLRGQWNRTQLVESQTLPEESAGVATHPYQADIQKWHQANADVKGWLDVSDTGISLPVVQHADNEYYLTRDATGADNKNGAAFIDYEVDHLTKADHVVIYGHNMENGQVFSDLLRYRDKAYADAHPTIRLATDKDMKTYEVVLAVDMDLTDPASFFSFNSWLHWDDEKDARKYMAEMRKRAVYDGGQSIEPDDRLLSLSTCENSKNNARCIVVAKEVATE